MNDYQSYLEQALSKIELAPAQSVPEGEDYDIDREIQQLVFAARNEQQLTQKQLAERSGVSQANISKIETGSYHPSLAVLKRIADGLGKRLVVFFDDFEEVD